MDTRRLRLLAPLCYALIIVVAYLVLPGSVATVIVIAGAIALGAMYAVMRPQDGRGRNRNRNRA